MSSCTCLSRFPDAKATIGSPSNPLFRCLLNYMYSQIASFFSRIYVSNPTRKRASRKWLLSRRIIKLLIEIKIGFSRLFAFSPNLTNVTVNRRADWVSTTNQPIRHIKPSDWSVARLRRDRAVDDSPLAKQRKVSSFRKSSFVVSYSHNFAEQEKLIYYRVQYGRQRREIHKTVQTAQKLW